MAKVVEVTGVREVVKNLKKAEKDIGKAIERGLKKAGLFLQRKSQQIVPVSGWDPVISPPKKTGGGTLKNSAFTRAEGNGINTEVYVGYTADYAIYVHENRRARHHPSKSAEFLTGPAKEHNRELGRIVAKEAGK